MPLYDYDCSACGRRFEVIHGVHADAPTSCPLCGSGPVRKAIAAPAVHFKGSGWAKKERRAPVKSGGGTSDGGEGDAGSGSDTKTPKEDTAPSTPSKASAADKNGTPSTSSSTKTGD